MVKLIPSEVAQKYLILPVTRTGATLTVAMADPTNVFAMDDIKFMTGYNVEPVVASEVAIKEAIDKYYGSIHALELKKVMDEMAETEDPSVPGGAGGGATTSTWRSWRPRPRRPRSSAWSTSSSPTPSSGAPRTSTSSPTRRTSGSGSGSTASCTRS